MALSDLMEVASNARADFEDRKVNEKLLKLLYQQYNPLDDIDTFVENAMNMFPLLNCGLASIYLQKSFSQGRIINGKYNHHNHTFLLIEESIVVNITSDQYGGPQVYVGQLQMPWSMD